MSRQVVVVAYLRSLWLRGTLVAVAVTASIAVLVVIPMLASTTEEEEERPARRSPLSFDPIEPGQQVVVRGQEFSLDGFRKLAYKDTIMPVYIPVFVSAAAADIVEGELVLGLEINGESKAYPVGTLSYKEMVIDEVGGVPVLVSW